MAKRIPVSFKETPRDDRLYDYVINEGDKSYFIKNAIEFYINYLNLKQVPILINNTSVITPDIESEDEGIGEILGIN